MRLIFFFGILFSLAAQSQQPAPLNAADQAILDQQLLEKAMAAQAIIIQQQNEALQRQQAMQMQNNNQQLQSQGNQNQGNGTNQSGQEQSGQEQSGQNNNNNNQNNGGNNNSGDIRIPNGPLKAGPFTQQPSGLNNSKELEKKISGRTKDPFMLPNHLYMKIKRKLGDIQGEGYVDESVAPQLRWALKRYKLVAIIWNVKRPKAMITDQKNDLHMFYVNDRIGNGEGVITSINNGEVIVNEKGTEVKLFMIK